MKVTRTRPRGRPKLIWRDRLKSDMHIYGISPEMATDRECWSVMVKKRRHHLDGRRRERLVTVSIQKRSGSTRHTSSLSSCNTREFFSVLSASSIVCFCMRLSVSEWSRFSNSSWLLLFILRVVSCKTRTRPSSNGTDFTECCRTYFL